jgi:hypothetical protein
MTGEKDGHMALRPLPAGVEQDQDVDAALHWLAGVSCDPPEFWRRIEAAQANYAAFTDTSQNLGQDPDLGDLGPDLVASFLAQGKSLIDGRRTYDIALASRCIPWIKQLGANINDLARVDGAIERARRMLADARTAPDGPMLELVMGGNYAADGMEVAFVPEAPGQAKTPDLHLFVPGVTDPVAIELKRLRQGQYEQEERARHRLIFKKAAAIINAHGLSLHIDVTYTRELKDVSEVSVQRSHLESEGGGCEAAAFEGEGGCHGWSDAQGQAQRGAGRGAVGGGRCV